MDNTSAIAAAHKADTLRVKVGYPLSPNTSDPRSLYYYYGTVKILNNTFFDNVVNAAYENSRVVPFIFSNFYQIERCV